MQFNYSWKRGLFDKTFEIYSNAELVGKINKRPFNNSAYVQTNQGTYNFKTHGFFKQETTILDAQNKVLGNITFSSWNRSAELNIQNQKFYWEPKGFLNKKWNLSNSEGIQIKYDGAIRKGNIESNIDNNLVVAAGLFTANFFMHKTGLLAAIIVSIIMLN